MTEPTVQVPVSLIEQIRDADRDGRLDILDDLLKYLTDLLSQPTPTAEPIPCPHWEPGHITMRKGCTACAATAEPPRIEDMAPGATFTAQVRFLIDSHGTALPHTGFDPSTIRDVTPPEDAA